MAAPRPGWLHHVSALPFAGPAWEAAARPAARGGPSRHRQIFCFPLPLAAVILNHREPGAYIYRETRVPRPPWAPLRYLLKNFWKFKGGVPIYYSLPPPEIWSFRPGLLKNTPPPGEGHIVFENLLSAGLQSPPSRTSAPLSGPVSEPTPASSLPSATCEPRRGPAPRRARFVLCGPSKKSSWRASG